MCTPFLLGLALVAGGTVAQAAAKQRADKAQMDVTAKAQKRVTDTRNQNRALLMKEVDKNAPGATAATNNVAAGEAQAAMQSGADRAVDLFQGGEGDQGAAGRITGRVGASLAPRTRALGTIEGQAEGERRRSRSMDRTNQNIDANDTATGRVLGNLPIEMQLAGTRGRGLGLAGQAAGAVGGGLVSGSMWGPATTAATGAGGRYTTSSPGASDVGPARRDPYGYPVSDPTADHYDWQT
jgi:hypothetical protein